MSGKDWKASAQHSAQFEFVAIRKCRMTGEIQKWLLSKAPSDHILMFILSFYEQVHVLSMMYSIAND
jgi:hypothetical protein